MANRGFTLVEMTLAMAIGSFVLLAALTSLNMVSEADQRTTEAMEQQVAVERSLRLITSDVSYATQVTVSPTRLTLEYPDLSAVIYEVSPTGDQLHRVTADSVAAATVAADGLALGSAATITLSPRGLLRDIDYQPTAVLQGGVTVGWQEILGSSGTVGVQCSITYSRNAALHTARATAVMQ